METSNQSDHFNIETKAKEVDSLLDNDRELIGQIAYINTDTAWNKLRNKKRSRILSVRIRRSLQYAAILLLFLLAGYYINEYRTKPNLRDTYTVFNVPNAEMSDVTLPDGTKIKLNSSTELKYSMGFYKKREVYLSGEAYFEVKSDPKNPFLVHIHDYTVKVTGTKFNIKSYPGINPETTLEEGKISVLSPVGKKMVELKPGENLILDKEKNQLLVKQVNTSQITNWTAGKIFIKNQTIEEIVKIIERWYDVKIVFDDESIKQLRITGTILKNKPVEQLLNVLVRSDLIDYSMVEDVNNQSVVHIKYRH